ncbi:MAG: SIS domain-containing protein [Chthoniobacterales bacterium]|nr:SIS domain-containing protein [Chthoniobacterales bacterium]
MPQIVLLNRGAGRNARHDDASFFHSFCGARFLRGGGRLSPFRRSLDDALGVFGSLSALEKPLVRAADAVLSALTNGGKLLLCGNGGSSSDAAHIAAEFVCRFCGDRRPYPALALGVDGGLLTAIGNDYEFTDAFSRQVHAFGKPGDVLIAISSSGKSRNVLAAIEEARRRKLVTIALLGRDGGFTKGAADIELIVEGPNTARIQEAQKFLLHVLCELAEEKLPKE